MKRSYRGRFAPSPTGPLHRGSLVTALASWLDARAHDGKWLIRIENIDPPRARRGAAEEQLAVLGEFGMVSDEPILEQGSRSEAYIAAIQQLQKQGQTYLCSCGRARQAARAGGMNPGVYPGTCRNRAVVPPAAVRFLATPGPVGFTDRAQGGFVQDVAQAVGDFIIKRADQLWAYQLAVVVDDAHQGITDVVRGADLLDNTPRQILLQRALGFALPRYLHVPLVCDARGRKLSKHDGAQALGATNALTELERALQHLGFAPTGAHGVSQFQQRAIALWRQRWCAESREDPRQGDSRTVGS